MTRSKILFLGFVFLKGAGRKFCSLFHLLFFVLLINYIISFAGGEIVGGKGKIETLILKQ